MTSQLLLFDPEPDAVLPDIRRRTLTEAELAIHLRHLQAAFDARTQYLPRCDECHGYVETIDTNGLCRECLVGAATGRRQTIQKNFFRS